MTYTTKHLIHETTKRLKEGIAAELIENKAMSIILYILLPFLYVMALIKNYDNAQKVVLSLLAIITGLFGVGRLGIKFFKELLNLIIEWRKANIEIVGARWLIPIALLIFLIILIAIICLALYISS